MYYIYTQRRPQRGCFWLPWLPPGELELELEGELELELEGELELELELEGELKLEHQS